MAIRRPLLLFFVLLGVIGSVDRPRADHPAVAFYGIGHLPSLRQPQAVSLVRDATQVGDVIYAVGGSATRVCVPGPFPPGGTGTGLCGFTDTAVLWRFDGTNPATLEALPNIAANTTFTTPLTAYAITPDAQFIASRARNSATTGARATVRVTTDDLTNWNLSGQFPELGGAVATAISSDGTILYGSTNEENFNPVGGFHHRGAVFDLAQPSRSAFILFVSPSDTWNPVAERGTSADGSVAVGSSYPTPTSSTIPTNHKAYRYVHGAPGVTTAIPLLDGGTYNDAVAVSPNGNVVLVTGNSAANPKGEAYLWRASTGETTPLGSPNSGQVPGAWLNGSLPGPVFTGGMTADGSVVAMSFFRGGPGDTIGYFRNAHGWFHLSSVLRHHGVDLASDGWNMEENLAIHGISSDGTLVFGAGVRGGKIEGFVAKFGPGDLASFNPQPVAPVSTALVGAWTNCEDAQCANPGTIVIFTADGIYFHIHGELFDGYTGFERGLYSFDGTTIAITTLHDTNGAVGLSGSNGLMSAVSVVGDTVVVGGQDWARRVVGARGTPVGAWIFGTPTLPNSSYVGVFLGSEQGSRFFQATDSPLFGGDGTESGTYAWDSGTKALDIFPTGGPPDLGNVATPAPNGLTMHLLGDDGDEFDVTRVIDPATIPVIANGSLSAGGVVGQALSHTVSATNAAAFSVTGLPGGLSMDAGTGEITGTPAVGGQFSATVTATNAHGVSDIETLTLTVAIPTPTGQNVVVEPEVPEGLGAVSITFDEIVASNGGTTTVTVLDPEDVPELPGGFGVAGIVYDVETSGVTYAGPIRLCFSYAGFDFGSESPRLIHYEDGEWVDITTEVVPETETVCGVTTSLSPFAILSSPVVRKGFYAPLNPLAAVLNTAKGGSTVPLKFEVSVNGVEQTSTAGLVITQQRINCDSDAPEDVVEPAPTTGGTSLRYDATAGYFIQNWKVPKTPGQCYMVRMTTEQDGLSLTARFKVK